MATGNILSAQINVTAPGAKEVFTQVASDATKTEVAIKKASVPVEKIAQSFEKVAPAAKRAEQSLQKITTTSNSANLALINTGRVVQDLPFGFLGIANNLNPLLESFQRLKAESGSTATAMKSLLSSLGGAGGLGFALSLVSSAMIVFGDKLFGGAAASKEAEKALQDYKDTIDDTIKSLQDLGKEVQFLNQLASLNAKGLGLPELLDLQGAALSQQQLLFTLRESRQKYIDDNKDLDREDEERNKAYLDGLKKIDDQIADEDKKLTLVRANIRVQRARDAKDAHDKDLQAYREYLKRLRELAEFEENLQKHLADRIKKIFNEKFNSTELDQKLRLKIGVDINTDDLATNFAKEQNISSQLQKRVDQLTKSNPILIRANLKVDTTGAEDTFKKFAENAAGLISDTLTPAFQGLFDNISSGGNALKGFFDGLVSGVKSLISQLIKAAIFAAVLNAILGKGSPGFGSLFGKALGFAEGGYTGSGGKYEPAGIVHKDEFVFPKEAVNRLGIGYLNNLAFGKSLRGYASGGLVGSGFVGSSGGGNHTVTFEIAGQKLRGVLSLADASFNRLR